MLLVLGPAAQIFQFVALPFDLTLISLDLVILLRRLVFTPLQLIADQRPCSQAENRPDRRACSRMPNRGTNDPAGGCSAQRADTRAFLSGG
jgi:hypothetical protein